ncbi:MAG: penicillin-binding transpeptidase domain-containing protein, partial [Pseudomonadota bacterium]
RPDMPMPELKGGLIPDKAWKQRNREEAWLIGDTLNSGIGQGFVLATPIQLAVMTARLATGRAIEARILRAENGQPVPVAEAPPLGIDERHLDYVRAGMDAVVNTKRGTANRSRIADEGNRLAGKTGTSQVRNITAAERAQGVFKNAQLPWHRRDHALFVGYAPFEAPRLAVAVVVEHGGGGSTAAAPVARDIIMQGLWNGPPPLDAWPWGQRPERPVPAPSPRPETRPAPPLASGRRVPT